MDMQTMYLVLSELRKCQEAATKKAYVPHSANGASRAVQAILAARTVQPADGADLVRFANRILPDALDVQELQDFLRDVHHITTQIPTAQDAD